MKLIRDLGMQFPTKNSKRTFRYGVFECPKCLDPFRTLISNKASKCKKCSLKILNKSENKGDVGTPLYLVWVELRQRCNNPKNTSYKYYGGKGVKVCAEWNKSFQKFKKWALGNFWEQKKHVSRKGDRGNYSPKNCSIKDAKQNMGERNKANGKLTGNDILQIKKLYENGEKQPIIAEKFGVTQTAISYHVRKRSI